MIILNRRQIGKKKMECCVRLTEKIFFSSHFTKRIYNCLFNLKRKMEKILKKLCGSLYELKLISFKNLQICLIFLNYFFYLSETRADFRTFECKLMVFKLLSYFSV